jgi:hypothetical protein
MFPPLPALPDDQRATGKYRLRFEDLAQDGRILFEAIVASVGAALWRPLLEKHPVMAAMHAQGVLPIFTRVAVAGTDARLALAESLTAEGAYQLAFEPDSGPGSGPGSGGGVSRMFLNMWTSIWGVGRAGQTRGERVLAGRFFGEHVLTRLHGSPEQRRVTEVSGLPRPEVQYTQRPREELLALPALPGAVWLEPATRTDPVPAVFGPMHTDSNQHVNSLVYPRLFEEAALRRLRELGNRTQVLGRSLEVAFRKPFFAGDAAGIALRAFASGDAVGVVGAFEAASGDTAKPPGKPSTYLRLVLEPAGPR